jgi:streptogramin lyase
MRTLAISILCISGCCLAADTKKAATPVPKGGIKTPGIQIPIEALKHEAEIAVETPGWITTGESVFLSNRSQGVVVRADPKTNKVLDPISGLNQPCSSTTVAFGTLWIPNCGAQTLTRIDTKAAKITATLTTGVADIMTGIAATADSVWVITDSKTTLSRIDPVENKVVAELRLPAGCNSVAFGEGSLWVTCPFETRLLRINPSTNLVDKRIEVAAGARAVAFGGGSVWVLCDKEGKIARIDPKTNKVVKTIELGVANAGGMLAFSDGFLWATQTGFPLTRIDPQADKETVAQQFWGEGGGLITAAPGAIWLSNVNKGTVWRLDPKRVIATLAE